MKKQMKKKKLNGIKANVRRSAYVYFLEHDKFNKWLTEKPDKNGVHRLTKDPLKAMNFKEKTTAKVYLYLNQKDGSLKDFHVTEHEFV